MIVDEINAQGFCLLTGAIEDATIEQLRARCSDVLSESGGGQNARSSRGHVYAARNLIDTVPETLTLWRGGIISDTLWHVLGDGFGLARALFFDKPPDRTWALP